MQRHLLLLATTCILVTAHRPASAKFLQVLASYSCKYPYERESVFRFRQYSKLVAALAATLLVVVADVMKWALASKSVVDAPIRQLNADRLYARSFDRVGGGEVYWAILITLHGRQAAMCFSDSSPDGKDYSHWDFNGNEAFSSSGPCPSEKQNI
jgi:hypothetical protein